MRTPDTRWEQRFNNYNKAFSKLDEAVKRISLDFEMDINGTIDEDEFLDDIIKEGLIQRFEYTHELAWNVMKDFLVNAGNTGIYGSKDATREAFAAELIHDGDIWMDMIRSRDKTLHTYNEETADDIFIKILQQYHPEFSLFRDKMEALLSGAD